MKKVYSCLRQSHIASTAMLVSEEHFLAKYLKIPFSVSHQVKITKKTENVITFYFQRKFKRKKWVVTKKNPDGHSENIAWDICVHQQ